MTSQYFGGRISGGAIGGFHTLEKYHEGQLSAEKGLLVRNIAQDLKSMLHFSADTERQPIDSLVAMLKQKLPNVRPGEGKTQSLSDKSSHQTAICQALAQSINRRYGRNVIDTNAPPGYVCEQASEVMNSLFSGLHGEFLGVATDVKRTLSNMQILRNSMEQSFERLFEVTRMGSDRAQMESIPIEAVFRAELAELDRQIAILTNMISGVISPTTRTIADLTSEDKDFRGFVRSLKHELGSSDLSRKMTYVLANVNNVALLAAQIDRALKAIGHDVTEYNKYKTPSDLLAHLHDSFEKSHKQPSTSDLSKFVAAIQMVRENDFMYDDIASELGNKAKRIKDPHRVIRHAAKSAKRSKKSKRGGGLSGEGDMSLEKRMERQRKTREVLFRDFEQRLEAQYRQISSSIDVLAKRFGSQIKIDDHLNKFVSCMKDLKRDQVDREKFYLALTGYQQDAASREERQRFLGHLGAVSLSLKPLIAASSGSERAHFESVRSAVDEVVKTIDNFKDTYLKPITSISFKAGGGTKGARDSSSDDDTPMAPQKIAHVPDEHVEASSVPDEDELSSSDADSDKADEPDDTPEPDNVADGGVAAHIASTPMGGATDGEGTFVTLGQAIRHLEFFYDVARVKHNLNISAKDIKGYAKEYESVLGQAVGDMKISIKKTYEQERQRYDDVTSDKVKDEAKLIKGWIKDSEKTGAIAPSGYTADELKQWRLSIKENALKYLKEQMQVKIDLLTTVEAIDIYLSSFADAIASNPDAIKELSQMLKSVDIVGKWFTEKSGNTVAELFESTASSMDEEKYSTINSDKSWSENQEQHYYKWVATLITPASADVRLPANPFIGVLPGRSKDEEDSVYDQIIERAKKAALSVRVLDNLVSTFAKLGSQNATGKTFMPPGVIFKNLRQYMFHSAIVMGMETPDTVSLAYPEPLTTASGIGAPGTSGNGTNEIHTRLRVGVMGTQPGSLKSTSDLEAAINGASPSTTDRKEVERWVRSRFALAFSSIPDTSTKNAAGHLGDTQAPLNGFSKCWQSTDQLFIMTIKSMIAKVFTVIGTYGIFNKPLDRYKSISSTRLILGGDFSIPDIKAEATELYIRLPLLAEFYRGVFDFDNLDPATSNYEADSKGVLKKITLVPEFDGVWENLIKIVFVDAKYVSEGGYSETHVKALVREINDIYDKYRNASSTVQDVISAFVAEVNRRYGIVKQGDVTRYIKDKRRYDINDKAYSDEDRLEYNILNERDQEGRGPAPSDRFDHTFASLDQPKIDNPWDTHYINLVYNFRNRIDSQIKNLMPKGDKPPKVSFDSTVRGYRQQVEAAKTNPDKYLIILKAMQGTDQLSTVNYQKALMFHETVVAPLNTLYSVWTVLNQFIRRVRALDTQGMEDRIEKAIDSTSGGNKNYKFFFEQLRGTSGGTPSLGYERYLNRGYVTPIKVPLDSTIEVAAPQMTTGTGDATDILVHRGTYAARKDVLWSDATALTLKAQRTGTAARTPQQANALEGLKRFLIDREAVFRDLTNLTFALASDLGDTCGVKIQGKNMLVEFGGLTEYCQTLLNSVKKNIEMFRGTIDDDIIRRVEGGTKQSGKTSPQPGSLYFIDEYLMERVLKDSRQGMYKKATEADFVGGIGIVMTNEIISRTFHRFCDPWKVTAHLDNDQWQQPTGYANERSLKPADLALFKHEQSLLYDSFERPMAELLYWKTDPATSDPVTAADLAADKDKDKLQYGHVLKQPRVSNHNVNDWPYAVIPSVERSGSEDDDIKTLKTIQDAMKALQVEIQYAGYTDTTGGGFSWTTTGFGFFQYTASLATSPLAWTEVLENYGIECDTRMDSKNEPVNAQLIAMSASGASGKAATARCIILGDRYNTLYKQRERIFQSSIRTPLDHRIKWYTDPSNAKEGAWFLNQLNTRSQDESGAGVSVAELATIEKRPQFQGGLLMRFNEILAKYLYAGWDSTKRSMYQGLISKFAGGTHVAATTKGEALNDINSPYAIWQKSGTHSGLLGVPAPHITVFASLARAMRNIMTNTKRSGDPEFRVDTMMELPIHMKETLKAALPGFDKLFKLVVKKAELLRQISQQVSLVRQLPFALKYGVNRQIDKASGEAPCSKVVYGDHITGAPDCKNIPGHLSGKNGLCHPNQALLEPNDVLHIATGFVIRNVTDPSILSSIITDTTKRLGTDWIQGQSTVNCLYHEGKRYKNLWAARSCWIADDRGAQLYVGYAPHDELTLEASKRWHVEMIDSIANSAVSISKCITDTYKELADEPKFLETHEGFISDYIQMNKHQPIMLLSQLQIALRNRYRDNSGIAPHGGEWDMTTGSGFAKPNFMLPFYRSGESPFKLQYGSRLVLGRHDIKPSLEYMPGMSGLLERYNGVSSNDARIEKTEFELSTIAHTQLLRYMTDLRFFRASLDSASSGRLYSQIYKSPDEASFTSQPVDGRMQVAAGSALFDTPLNIAFDDGSSPGHFPKTAAYTLQDKVRSYPLQCTLEEVLAITESSDQDDTLKSLVASLHTGAPQIDSRSKARIYNLIDLNIVPINVHALMREIPLVNIINYSYTCDRMIQDKLMPDTELPGVGDALEGKLIDESTVVSSTRGMLTKMLLYPYARVNSEEYYGYIARIMTGDSGLELGRPKFLSDQLWNKVLFQELYTQTPMPSRRTGQRNRPDESGPQADSAQRRALKGFRDHPDRLYALGIGVYGWATQFKTAVDTLNSTPLGSGQLTAAITAISTIITQLNNTTGQSFIESGGYKYDTNLSKSITLQNALIALAPLISGAINVTGTAQALTVRKLAPQYRQMFQRIQERVGNDTAIPPISMMSKAKGREGDTLKRVALATFLFAMIEESLNDGKEIDHFENTGQLQYPEKDDEEGTTVIRAADFSGCLAVNSSAVAIRQDLANLGRLRFDTTFIRNLFFLVNMQRVMRMIMRDETQFLESPVVNSSSVINRQITEFSSNEVFDAEVFHQ